MPTDSPSRPGLAPSPEPARLEDGPRIARIARRQGGRPDALIEVLHQVQEPRGHLPPEALDQVARQLNLPLSRVWGVASFYHLFHLTPPKAHRCAVCLGTACFVLGGAELARDLEARLGVKLDDLAGHGLWGLEQVSCLGACGQAPVLVVDGAMLTRLPTREPARLAQRLDEAGVPSNPGATS